VAVYHPNHARCLPFRLAGPLESDWAFCGRVSELMYSKKASDNTSNAPLPLILLSRCRDNVYICLSNVPQAARESVKQFCSVLLHSIYGIKFKWEPHGTHYTWGKGSIGVVGVDLDLLRKGTTIVGDSSSEGEWLRWVDTTFPHARHVSGMQVTLHAC